MASYSWHIPAEGVGPPCLLRLTQVPYTYRPNEMSPLDRKYSTDVNILKQLAAKDKKDHVYFYHDLTIPGTSDPIDRVDLIDNMVVLRSKSTVEFWKHLHGMNYKKLADFNIKFPIDGCCVSRDVTRQLKDQITLIYSDIWTLDQTSNAHVTYLSLHLCVCLKSGHTFRRLLSLPLSGVEYLKFAHCILPDASLVMCSTYKKQATGTYYTYVMHVVFDELFTSTTEFSTWADVDGFVSAIEVSKQHPKFVVVHCDPLIHIFNKRAIAMHCVDLTGSCHIMQPGVKRFLVAADTDEEKGIAYLTFKSTDGIVEEIMFYYREFKLETIRKIDCNVLRIE